MAKKIKYDQDNPKKWTFLDRISDFGKTRICIRCAFCPCEFWAFVWSLSGGGKKCPNCGALHYSGGMAQKVIENG